MTRLDQLINMPRALTRAEEEEGKRLWAEKHDTEYKPAIVIDEAALDAKYGAEGNGIRIYWGDPNPLHRCEYPEHPSNTP